MAKHAAGDEGTDLAAAIRIAIHAVGRGDAESWRFAVERACAADAVAADRIARDELADRLRSQQIEAGMLVQIVNGATILASATQDGPFRCPAFLFELAIRRALDEPGCVEQVDVAELVHASTQCAGMIDLHDALLPPGWGWLISLPLPDQL